MNVTISNDELFDAILKACKENEIEIDECLKIEAGGKIGVEATHQFNIMKDFRSNEYSCSRGVGGSTIFNLTKEDAIKQFVSYMIDVVRPNKSILKFISLVIPKKAVEKAELLEKDNILIRYIIDYLPQTDSFCHRWDILIKVYANV